MRDPEGRLIVNHEAQYRAWLFEGVRDVLIKLGDRGILWTALAAEFGVHSDPRTRALLRDMLAALERAGVVRSEATSSGGRGQGRPGVRWFIADKDAL